jgi:PPOX class probable F420-dependent enzyme
VTELSEHALSLLRGPNVGHFATLNADGSVHAAPVWIDVDDQGHVLVNSAVGRRKDRNIRRDPRVAISIHDQDDPYRWASINGTVVSIEPGPEAEEHIDRLNQRYRNGERWTYVEGQQRVIFRIRPDHLVGGHR